MPNNSDLKKSGAKILQLANTLNLKEWKNFDDFIHSPFYNKDERLHKLYKILNQHYPFQESIYKTDLLPILGFKNKYSNDYVLNKKEDGLLRKIMTIFCQLLEKYIIHLESSEQPSSEQRLLANFLLKRKAYDLIPSILNKELATLTGENNHDYYHKYLAEECLFYLHIIKKSLAKTDNLQAVLNNLNHYNLSTLILYYCSAINRENIFNIHYNYAIIEHIILFIEKDLTSYNPLTQIYFHISKLLKNDNIDFHFKEALILYYENQNKFNTTTKRQIINFLLNTCSQQIRCGNFQYKLKKHELYLNGIQNKLFSTELYLSSYHFYLIVQNANKLNKFKWLEKFINNNQNKLAPKYGNQTLNLSKAHQFLYQKKHTQALIHLNQVNLIKDFFLTIYYKVLSIQIYYEHYPIVFDNKEHPIDATLQALRIYLDRNKTMSDRIKNSYKNFMRFSKRLIRIRVSQKIHLLERLKKDIKEEKYVDERDWLIKKIDLLLQKE